MINHHDRFNKWAKNYDKSILQRILFSGTHNYITNVVDRVANDGDSILDIACGTGKLLEKIFSSTIKYIVYYGVDYSKEMIKEANKRIGFAELECKNSTDLPYYEKTFNIIVCSHAFHHFLFQDKSIKEMNRVLRKGGRVIIADGCVDDWWGNTLFGKIINKIEHGVFHLPKEKLNLLLTNNGFEIEKQVVINKLAPTLITIAKKVR